MFRKNGFTLIELLVAISIVAVLSVIGMTIYQGVQAKARDSIRKRDLNNLAIALEIYAQQNGKYITTTGGIITCPAPTDTTSSFYTRITPNMSDGVPPQDPKNKTLYCYLSPIDGSTYTLCANLENTQDPDYVISGCGDSNYHYVLTPR